MKLLFDSDAFVALAVEGKDGSQDKRLLEELRSRADVSLWVSALCFAALEGTLARMGKREKVCELMNMVMKEFSIIPLRRSILAKAAENGGPAFESMVQAASAEQFHMDFIVTPEPDDYRTGRVLAIRPTELLEKLNSGIAAAVNSVPFLDLRAQHHQIYNEIDDRMTDIIVNTGFVLGKHVDEFEKRFAGMQGAEYCIGVSSGTDALHVALMALGIGPGDGVIVPVNTFIATAEAVSLCGAIPVFVDCDEYYNLDVEKVEELVKKSRRAEEQKSGNGVRAIVPVHLYGQPANMDEIMALADEYGLEVVEDCCQAHLAKWKDKKVGNFGAFGAFSFYPGKNLGAYGEAGALICNDEELYLKAKKVRQHGEIERYRHQVVGHNYRMAAFQGAVLSTKLNYIEEWTRKRQENARLYSEWLADIEGIETPRELEGVDPVYHLYVIQTDDRDGLREYLQEHGVASGLHYPVPLHLQEAYRDLGYEKGDFPVAEKAAARILSLPMYPELSEGRIRYVCEQIESFMNQPQTHTD